MRKITTFQGHDNREYQIYFGADEWMFYTTVDGNEMCSQNIAELADKARLLTIPKEELDWKPVIVFRWYTAYGSPDFDTTRCYIATDSAGDNFMCHWTVPENERNIARTAQHFDDNNCSVYADAANIVIPYTDELYNKFNNIIDSLNSWLFVHLKSIIDTK